MLKRRLKDNAYPSIFKKLPAYYTVLIKAPLFVQMSLHVFLDIKIQQQGSRNNEITLKILNDLLEKISKEIHHQEYLLHQSDVDVNLFYLSPQQPLSIKASINAGVEVTIYQKQQVMPPPSYQHIISNNKL